MTETTGTPDGGPSVEAGKPVRNARSKWLFIGTGVAGLVLVVGGVLVVGVDTLVGEFDAEGRTDGVVAVLAEGTSIDADPVSGIAEYEFYSGYIGGSRAWGQVSFPAADASKVVANIEDAGWSVPEGDEACLSELVAGQRPLGCLVYYQRWSTSHYLSVDPNDEQGLSVSIY